jgi:hypothetical protein
MINYANDVITSKDLLTNDVKASFLDLYDTMTNEVWYTDVNDVNDAKGSTHRWCLGLGSRPPWCNERTINDVNSVMINDVNDAKGSTHQWCQGLVSRPPWNNYVRSTTPMTSGRQRIYSPMMSRPRFSTSMMQRRTINGTRKPEFSCSITVSRLPDSQQNVYELKSKLKKRNVVFKL